MAILRNDSRNQYTVVNHSILRDNRLSLKGLGLLVRLLSLPDNWDFSEKGLMAILSQDGQTSIRTGLKELENLGYLTRERTRGEKGQILDVVWTIRETPKKIENPQLENQSMDNASLENHLQSNINKDKELNNFIINQSYLSEAETTEEPKPTPKRATEQQADRIRYEEIIKENIDYDYLIMDNQKDDIDEIVSILLDAVTSQSEYIRISGQDRPSEAVKSQLLKLDYEHINYVLMCLNENTTKVRNIKSYLLTSLYNAPMTMSNYYTTRVRHDMANMG